jgi:hypothetical protein
MYGPTHDMGSLHLCHHMLPTCCCELTSSPLPVYLPACLPACLHVTLTLPCSNERSLWLARLRDGVEAAWTAWEAEQLGHDRLQVGETGVPLSKHVCPSDAATQSHSCADSNATHPKTGHIDDCCSVRATGPLQPRFFCAII